MNGFSFKKLPNEKFELVPDLYNVIPENCGIPNHKLLAAPIALIKAEY